MTENEKKDLDRYDQQRSTRLKAGGVGVAASLILVFCIEEFVLPSYGSTHKYLPDYIVIALATLVGSLTTMVTICYWDIHDIALAWMKTWGRRGK